jgi:hypothetical protein
MSGFGRAWQKALTAMSAAGSGIDGHRLVAHKTCCVAFVMAHPCRRCLSHSILASLMLVRAVPEAGAISIRMSLT